MDRTGIFISYSHSDDAWLSRLVDHLAVLERADLVQTWSDLKIDFGGRWRDEIDEALTRSKVAILLLSPAFFASRFIWDSEMPLIEAHQRNGMQVLPIIVRPCAWRLKESIAEMQALPSNNRALALLADAEADAALASIVYAVAHIVARIAGGEPPAEQLEAAPDEAEVSHGLMAPTMTMTMTVVADRETAALCSVPSKERDLIASPGAGGMVRIWELVSGATHRELSAGGSVRALAIATADDRSVLASAGGDGSVQIWDLATWALIARLEWPAATALCTVDVSGSKLLALGGENGRVRLWDPWTGERAAELAPLAGAVRGLCTVQVGGHDRLAYGGDAGQVMVWDTTDPTLGVRIVDRRDGPVRALSATSVERQEMLVSGGDDGVVKIIDLGDAATPHGRGVHDGAVRAACPVRTSGRELLATAGADTFVRLWDPSTMRLEEKIPANGPALAMATSGRHLVVGTDTGIIGLELLGI